VNPLKYPIKTLSALLLLIGFSFQSPAYSRVAVKKHLLKNKIPVYTALNPGLQHFKIKLVVNVGYANESGRESGISHLLEHLFFRQFHSIEAKETWTQYQEKRNLTSNAATSSYETEYWAQGEKKSFESVVKNLFQMVFSAQFNEKDIQGAKGPVFMEIGQPSWIQRTFGRNPINWLDDFYFRIPSYEEREFGIPHFYPSLESEISNTYHSLNGRLALDFYKKYYRAERLRIFLVGAGGRNEKKALALLNSTFGALPSSGNPIGPRRWDVNVRSAPYVDVSTESSSGVSKIDIGLKLVQLDVYDFFNVQAYFDRFKNKLFDEYREKAGTTYSPSVYISYNQNHVGTVRIRLETPNDLVSERKAELIKMLFQDSQHLEKGVLKRILSNYKKTLLDTHEGDVSELMALAELKYQLETVFGYTGGMRRLVSELTLQKLEKTLKERFRPEQMFLDVMVPFLVWQFELLIIFFLAFVFSFYGVKKYWRWRAPDLSGAELIRVGSHTTGYLFEITVFGFFSYLGANLIVRVFRYYAAELSIFRTVPLLYEYGFIAVFGVVFCFLLLWLLSLRPIRVYHLEGKEIREGLSGRFWVVG